MITLICTGFTSNDTKIAFATSITPARCNLTWKVTPYPSIVDFFLIVWQWVPPTWKKVVDPAAFRMFAGWITDERKIYKHISEGSESLLSPWEEDPGLLKKPKLRTHLRYWRIKELNNFTCERSSFVFLYVCTTIRLHIHWRLGVTSWLRTTAA